MFINLNHVKGQKIQLWETVEIHKGKQSDILLNDEILIRHHY